MDWLTPAIVFQLVCMIAFAFVLILYPQPPKRPTFDPTRNAFSIPRQPLLKQRTIGLGFLVFVAVVLVDGWKYHL